MDGVMEGGAERDRVLTVTSNDAQLCEADANVIIILLCPRWMESPGPTCCRKNKIPTKRVGRYGSKMKLREIGTLVITWHGVLAVEADQDISPGRRPR